MKIFYALSQELKKTIFNVGFILCILITVILFFTTILYVESSTGKIYSVIEGIIQLDKKIFLSDPSFAAINVFSNAISGYFLMFIPIIAAFPFIPNYCSERNSGLIRFTIYRVGKMKYYISKFLSALLGGGFAVFLGYAIFGLIIYFIFPSHSSYISLIGERKTNIHLMVLKSLLGVFLYGSVSAVPAFLMTSFVRNRYIITCVPFMIIYLYNTSLTKISYDAMLEKKNTITDFVHTLRPETISSLAYYNNMVRNSLLINIAFVCFCFCVFAIIMNRRWDFGE